MVLRKDKIRIFIEAEKLGMPIDEQNSLLERQATAKKKSRGSKVKI
jgi:hypothetical protein